MEPAHREKVVLEEDNRELPQQAKRMRSSVVASPEPAEVADSPSYGEHSVYQDVATTVSNMPEINHLPQANKDERKARGAVATVDHHREEEMVTQSLQIPNCWVPNMMFLKVRTCQM